MLPKCSSSVDGRVKSGRRRDQYTDIDSVNKIECANENSSTNQSSTGRRSAQGWNSLRAVVAYYCSLRKIKRNGFILIVFLAKNIFVVNRCLSLYF